MTQKEFKMDVMMPHNNYVGVRKSLESLRKHTPPENLGQVIFIDQSKEYQQVDDLVDLHIFTHGRNLGYAKCFNIGCRLSDAKYVFLLNDDVEFINKRWVDGIVETFERYKDTALAVNPSSPRNPKGSGEEPVNNMGIEYKDEFPESDYDLMLEKGGGHIIDGICMFATVFDRAKLNKTAGVIPGAWMDEWFWPGGGEDYDLNRRAYLTKNDENKFRGYRCLGTGLSFIWHWWYSTRRQSDGIAGVKHCGNQWVDKWGTDENGGNVDLYGKLGRQTVPDNIIRPLEECK